MNEVPIEALQRAVEGMHGGTAALRAAEHVKETFGGETVWEGDVYAFTLSGHPTASTCYAWSAPVAGTEGRRFFAVLQAGPVKSARDAVRASIVESYRQATSD